MSDSPDATQIVVDLSAGRQKAAEDLLPLMYRQLHDLAERYMQHERADHILQPTALVHEAYMKLVDNTKVDWRGRTHFLRWRPRRWASMQEALGDKEGARDHLRKALEQFKSMAISNPAYKASVDDTLEALARLGSS